MLELLTFENLTIIVTLVALEGLLSADNALVLAVLVRPLPQHQQKKALLYGIFGAFFFRFLMLLTAAWIIKLWYLRLAGAGYLAWLTIRHFQHRFSGHRDFESKPAGFWMTVVKLNLIDCAFAIDSVLAAVGLSNHLAIVFIGVALGIIAVRVAAGQFIRIIDKWPALEDVAYALVGWIAVKLLIESYGMYMEYQHFEMPDWLFWGGMGGIVVGGSFYAVRRAAAAARKAKLSDLPTLEEV